ncbi:MAG: beta-ketoacyl synthase N-terminal-like domain-containing protein, partial [Thermoanaerobaculia bacterium]
VYAASERPRRAFGSLLVTRGLVSEGVLRQALEVQNQAACERRLGAILVEMGELAPDDLRSVMVEQLAGVFRDLLAWADGYFKFQTYTVPDRGEVEVDCQDLVVDEGLEPDGVLVRAMAPDEPETLDPEPGAGRQTQGTLSLRQVMAEVRSPAFTGETTLQILRYASHVLRRGVLFVLGAGHARPLGQFGLEPERDSAAGRHLRRLALPLDEPSVVAEAAASQETFRGRPARSPWNEHLAQALGGEADGAPQGQAGTRASAPRAGESPEVAIVGMAGRFPGARDLDAYWELLEEGREGIRTLTDEELRRAGLTEEDWSKTGYVRARGVLEGAETFDAAFFGYSPREAEVMDPQQRAFLEAAWEALEHAGYDPHRAEGRIGVFGGAGMNTYLMNLLGHPEVIEAVGAYQAAIANKNDTLPTRVSYKLGLVGPSVNVQTACSTSLVAVHVACRALLNGDCDAALAGGVSISGTPTAGYRYQPGGIASPDGHCRAFDADGRGTVAGEGVGVVVLKRLADALADGDTVHAVIRGTAINNDGSLKAGFTAPSVQGQAAAISHAHATAGVDPSSIGYVEAHGTGTELGDPIEIAALTQAFGDGSGPPEERGACALGSVKTNLGHLDAAAGVAGLIKTVLALKHGRIPPSLHFRRPNPKIRLDETLFTVAAELADWPPRQGPRRAGVSSFGIGGTNAHAVLEEAPDLPESGPSRPWHLLVVSARSEPALEESTRRLVAHLRAHPNVPLADVTHTLQAGRRPWELRRAVVCGDAEEGAAFLEGAVPRRLLAGSVSEPAQGTVFLFPGQGSQHPGMAAETYRHEPVFREELDRCAEILRPELGLDLRDLLFPEEGAGSRAAARLQETALAQPALLAVEYALARLWESWGLEPEAMVGHSVGEYTAACLAGVVSLEDALALVAARGRLMQSMPSGAMLAVSRSEEEVLPLLREAGVGLSLAAVNGPEAVVVSGPTGAVEDLQERLTARGAGTRRLHTSHAFHSAMMDPVLEPFAEHLGRVTLHPPRRPFVSNLTGAWITAGEATDPEYWARQLRGTVRFAEGLGTLLETPERALLEVGPGRGLATLARQHPDAARARTVVHSLPHPRAEDSDGPFLQATLARLWVAGVEVDWAGYRRDERRRRVPLPTYPFQRRQYWVARTRRPGAGRAAAPPIASGSAVEATEAHDAEAERAGGPASPAEAALPRTTPYEAPRSELERAVAEIWQELLGTPEVGRHDEFFELGGSSLLALRLSARLRERVGVELDPHALLERPTVAGLAEAVAEALGGAAGEPLEPAEEPAGAGPEKAPAPLWVEIQAGDPAVAPLVLVHPAGGHAFRFRALGRTLSAAGFEGPVLALRSPGLEPGEEPLESVPAMARRYLEEIRRSRPEGAESPDADTPGCPGGPAVGPPFRLAGASMGGMIAYEMARLLLEEGETVEFLGLLDTFGPGQLPEVFREAAREAAGGASSVDPERGGPADHLPLEAERARRVAAANTRAMLAYEPPAYPGPVAFFRAAERRPGDPLHPELAWIGPAGGGTQVYVVPGDHESMLEPPNVEVLAGHLTGWLKGSGSGTPPAGEADRRRRPTARGKARKTPSPA